MGVMDQKENLDDARPSFPGGPMTKILENVKNTTGEDVMKRKTALLPSKSVQKNVASGDNP